MKNNVMMGGEEQEHMVIRRVLVAIPMFATEFSLRVFAINLIAACTCYARAGGGISIAAGAPRQWTLYLGSGKWAAGMPGA
jgi:hypothetical protein